MNNIILIVMPLLFLKFISFNPHNTDEKKYFGKEISSICISNERDSLWNLTDIQFEKKFQNYSFKKCLILKEYKNFFCDTISGGNLNIWKGHIYGLMVLKDGKKIPIKISSYANFFIELQSRDKYIINQQYTEIWLEFIRH